MSAGEYYVYVDVQRCSGRPFYVGKGRNGRKDVIERHEIHTRIISEEGSIRLEAFRTASEQLSLAVEATLIETFNTNSKIYGDRVANRNGGSAKCRDAWKCRITSAIPRQPITQEALSKLQYSYVDPDLEKKDRQKKLASEQAEPAKQKRIEQVDGDEEDRINKVAENIADHIAPVMAKIAVLLVLVPAGIIALLVAVCATLAYCGSPARTHASPNLIMSFPTNSDTSSQVTVKDVHNLDLGSDCDNSTQCKGALLCYSGKCSQPPQPTREDLPVKAKHGTNNTSPALKGVVTEFDVQRLPKADAGIASVHKKNYGESCQSSIECSATDTYHGVLVCEYGRCHAYHQSANFKP